MHAEFLRELRPVPARVPSTSLDRRSPQVFFGAKIGDIFKKKRARQDSNLRPPA